LDVLRAAPKPAQITQIGVNDATDAAVAPPRLWFAATIGCGDDEYFKELFDQQINPVWTTVDENNVGGMIGAGIRPWRYTVDAFPMEITTAALTSYEQALQDDWSCRPSWLSEAHSKIFAYTSIFIGNRGVPCGYRRGSCLNPKNTRIG